MTMTSRSFASLRMTVVGVVMGLTAFATSDAGAQQQSRGGRRLSALALELDGIGGYTLVDLNSWVRPGRVTDSDRDLAGFNGRLFLANVGDARLGLEVGRSQLFEYHVRSQDGTIQDSVDIESWYGGFAVRLPETRRFFFDFSMGMYKLPKNFLSFRDSGMRLSTGFAVYYRLASYRGVSLPIGARIASILDDRSAVLPAALTAGIQISPFRAARGR
jgi:hypothetical protein